jgi:hypothetical protein
MILAQSYRLEPEFANESLSLNVYVFRFITIEAVKVESITLFNTYGRHVCKSCPDSITVCKTAKMHPTFMILHSSLV